ncbi:MAG TPA: alpha/beta hydrolase [Polyangiales bacterium]
MNLPRIDTEQLFEERAAQFIAWGIPRSTVERVRARVQDMWADAPGGFCFEWGLEAEAMERIAPMRAVPLWGAARFPAACTEGRKLALARQRACYLRAAAGFPAAFERRVIDGVPTHLFTRRPDAPLVLLSGGLDTFKMDLHRLAIGLVRAGLRVAAIDMPGTGETPGPLRPDAHLAYEAVLDATARGARRGIFGLSFAGHWAAKLALRATVDAAIDIGGPLGVAPFDAAFVRNLPNGMSHSLAHALGAPALPSPEALGALFEAFALRDHLPRLRTPLLVMNGDADPYIGLQETTAFRVSRSAEVRVLRGAKHCAGDRFARVAPYAIAWLRAQLAPQAGTRALLRVTRLLLPAQARSA